MRRWCTAWIGSDELHVSFGADLRSANLITLFLCAGVDLAPYKIHSLTFMRRESSFDCSSWRAVRTSRALFPKCSMRKARRSDSFAMDMYFRDRSPDPTMNSSSFARCLILCIEKIQSSNIECRTGSLGLINSV